MYDFVEQYISDCIEDGVNSPKDICHHVLKEIAEVDKILAQQNQLRTKRANLQKVLRNFNHESLKKPRKNTILVNPDVADEDLDPSYKNLLVNVCDFIKESSRPVMPREIMDSMMMQNVVDCDYVDDKQRCVYMSIKWLLDKGIVSRNDTDRSIFPGENWNHRPE